MELFYSYVLAAPKNFETSQRIAYDKIINHGYRKVVGICLCGPTINPMVIMEGPKGLIVVPSEFIASIGGYDDGTARISAFQYGNNSQHRNQPHNTFINNVTFPLQYTEIGRKMNSGVCVALMEPFSTKGLQGQMEYPAYIDQRYRMIMRDGYGGTTKLIGATDGSNMNMIMLARNTMTISNIYCVGNTPLVYRVILSSTVDDYPNSKINDGETQTLNLLYNTNTGDRIVGSISVLCTAKGLALLEKFLEPTNFRVLTDGIVYYIKPAMDKRGNKINLNYFVEYIRNVNGFFKEVVVPHYGNEALSSLGTFQENIDGLHEVVERFIEPHREFGNHTQTLELMTIRNRELKRILGFN